MSGSMSHTASEAGRACCVCRRSCQLGLVLLGHLQQHVAVLIQSERDEIRSTADRAVFGIGLLTAGRRVHDGLVLFTAKRARVRHRL